MKRTNPTPAQIKAALEFMDVRPRTACAWLITWPEIEPTVKRYQTPVTLAHVLGEHHAAIAAEPIHHHNGVMKND